jgi:transposase
MWHTKDMPRLNYKLNEEELQMIEGIIKSSKDVRVVKRATAIKMLHLGHKLEEVSQALSVSVPSLYNWVHRWKSKGESGLQDQAKSGRPPTADQAYIQVLEETLEKDPWELGYNFNLWTISRLNQHVTKVTGKQIGDERLRVLLRSLGWVYRRPKEDLAHMQDQDAREKAAELLEELKKAPSKNSFSSFSLWTKQP